MLYEVITVDNEIGSLWKRLTAYLEGHPVAALPPDVPAWFEAHVMHPASAATGDYEVRNNFV